MGLHEVPERMGWGEAYRVMDLLARDPSTWVAAAFAGWVHPLAREALTLADLYDATTNAHFKKPKKYPRPWDEQPKVFGSQPMTKARLRAILDANRVAN